MRGKKGNLHSRLKVCITESELESLKKGYENSTCYYFNDYLRGILTAGPITVYYRNKSWDELLDEMIRLRNCFMEVLGSVDLTEEDKKWSFSMFMEIKSLFTKIYDNVSKTDLQQKYPPNFRIS